ncbi:mucin-2 [Anopheles bellator]|uniref:mucin-2 n=1 Tax=Anopheles bellator TaxID=139047 RepID=UPI00264797AD|nr:mucin-2 [Anopheles bellator]
MSSQIPPLVCHTPPPIDFDREDDEDDYGPDIPDDDDVIDDDGDQNVIGSLDDDFGDFAAVPFTLGKPFPNEAVIDGEPDRKEQGSRVTENSFAERMGNDSPPSLVLPPNDFSAGIGEGDEEEDDIDFQPFGCPTQPSDPPPEDCISLPSLHLDADVSRSEEDDNISAAVQVSVGSGIDTEVDLPAAAAERTTPVIQEGSRFDDNTENDFTDFTTASNERSSVVLEIPTANDVSFELDDFAQLESTPSVDSNFVSQQSRTDFATFDADFSKFDSFQASFPATGDDGAVPLKTTTPVDEAKSVAFGEQSTSGRKPTDLLPEDDFDEFQEFATFSAQPKPNEGANLAPEPANDASNREEEQTFKTTSSPADGGGNFAGTEDDDEFGEFSDFQQPENSPSSTAVPTFSMETVHNLLEKMFPTSESPVATDTGQRSWVIPETSLHSQLQDFDNTNAVGYQYSKSSSGKALVTALGIDSRNIMYGPKWNSSMPRFAANLSFNPLEPLKPSPVAPKEAPTSANEKSAGGVTFLKMTMNSSLEPPQPIVASGSVPAAQFDWNSSGLVNPLEASHAHTLLLDLEQLEVMASLKDKINVDSSSYSPAHRFAPNVVQTVQTHSPTTGATMAAITVTTTTSQLLPSPSLLPIPPPPQLPPSSASLPLPTTNMNTNNHLNKQYNQHQPPLTNDNKHHHHGDLAHPGVPATPTLLCFTDANDRDLMITMTSPMAPESMVSSVHPDATPSLPVTSVAGPGTGTLSSLCVSSNVDVLSVSLAGAMQSCTADRRQSFDDYLDLSVQEMLQKAPAGEPADGAKGEVLDSKVPEDTGPPVANDLAVVSRAPEASSPAPAPAVQSTEDDEDVRSLDFSNTHGSNAHYSTASLSPQAMLEPQQQQHYPPNQQQSMSISASTSHGGSVPVIRTIKLPETHIFTPSRGGTPVSRDITDRDIVLREYHDVEYSLERSAGARKESESDEFNDFQSVPPVAQHSITYAAAAVPPPAGDYAKPVIGRSPTEETEQEQRQAESVKQTLDAKRHDPLGQDAFGDDDFTDFQAAPAAVAQSVGQPVNKPVSGVQHNRSNTSSPVMLLSPAILLPQQAAPVDSRNDPGQDVAQINWPEPGVDPDELARFEAAFAKPVSQAPPPHSLVPQPPKGSVPSAASQKQPKPVASHEEDEWTDFISSNPVVNDRPNVAVTVSATTQPMAQEEWTDFISSAPATGGPTSQGNHRLSSSQNHFNYSRPPVATSKSLSSWSQPQLPPPQFSSWHSASLYYNPMSSLPVVSQRHPPPPTTQNPYYASVGGGAPAKLPSNTTQHQQQQHHGGYHPARMAQVAGAVNLLPELSIITPNAAGVGAPGHTKSATHSFLNSVISSNSFAKK